MSIVIWPNRLSFSMPKRTARAIFGCALAAGMLVGERAAAEPEFLADGGSISVGGPIYSSGSGEFLKDGGSISIERLEGGQHGRQREFLEDGGSITSGASRAFHRGGDRQREFLEDGGSITSGASRAFHRRGHRDDRRHDSFLGRGGSVTTVYDVAPRRRDDRPAISDIGQRTSRSDGVRYRGDDDTGDHGGYRSGGYGVASYGTSPGPKIIDVESARLDRRPVAPGTIEIVHAGGAKIIRIGPHYRRQSASAARTASAPRAAPLEPWTRQWLRHCMQAHPSFEPNFGTYRASDGRNRFCTGE